MGTPANSILLLVGALAIAATNVDGFRQQQAVRRNTNSNRNSNLNANVNTNMNTNFLDSLSSKSLFGSSSFASETRTPQQAMAETPDEHYAKEHFGAGWAGYKHSLYGGYLDNLNTVGSNDSVEDKEEEQETKTTSATTMIYMYKDAATDDDQKHHCQSQLCHD